MQSPKLGWLAACVVATAALANADALAKASSHGGSGHTGARASTAHAAAHAGKAGHRSGAGKDAGAGPHAGSKAVPGVKRDAHGRIARSPQAKSEFRRAHPCPSTGKPSGACPGYVIDHRVPLKRGGADRPDNMQWQTTAAAKAKDKTE